MTSYQREDQQGLISPKSDDGRCTRWRTFLGVACVVVLAIASIVVATTRPSAKVPPELPTDPKERALSLMRMHVMWDGHNDLPWMYRGLANNQINPPTVIDIKKNMSALIQTDLPRLRQGHVSAQFWSVYVSCDKQNKDAVRATLEQVDDVHRLARYYSSDMQLSFSSNTVQETFASGKIASFIAIEGGHSIDSSLAALRMFYGQGVRVMGLAHNCNTPWADSCAKNATHNGLTAFGQQVVREMSRLGMLVDLSHAHELTMHAVLDLNLAPVIFTHSNARALCDHPRNVPDAVLDRLAKTDGVVMVNFVGPFVNCTNPHATIADVVSHIEYISKRIGSNHVGIGADFDGNATLVEGLTDVSRYPDLISELIRRGFTDDQVIGFMGGNVLRALASAEKVAASLATVPPYQDIISDSDPEISENACRTPSNV